MELSVLPIELPLDSNVILGQAHFIKTVDDLHDALQASSSRLRFGLAFCESSGPQLIRCSGNDGELTERAAAIAARIGAGHSFVILLRDGFPVSVLPQIKLLPTVCNIYCATANSLEVIVATTRMGSGILGVVDGGSPAGVESDADVVARQSLLKKLGYRR
jgi:adenosine/AMP kinase